MSFSQALVLFPLAVAVHVLEEWPRFPRWARRFASPKYSDREYLATHALAIVSAAGAVAVVRAFPTPWILFVPALAVAGVFHTIEVGHNVFKRW